jgi:hypothetical protein
LDVLKLAILVSGVLALAKLGFLDFITGGFDTGRFGGLPFVACMFYSLKSFAEIRLLYCYYTSTSVSSLLGRRLR